MMAPPVGRSMPPSRLRTVGLATTRWPHQRRRLAATDFPRRFFQGDHACGGGLVNFRDFFQARDDWCGCIVRFHLNFHDECRTSVEEWLAPFESLRCLSR